jgi:hypothetical protein
VKRDEVGSERKRWKSAWSRRHDSGQTPGTETRWSGWCRRNASAAAIGYPWWSASCRRNDCVLELVPEPSRQSTLSAKPRREDHDSRSAAMRIAK